MHEAVIVSGARTAIGKFGGSFKEVTAPDLAAVVIKAALKRANLSHDIADEVILGNVFQSNEAGYTARLSALRAGISQEVPAITINRQCSSGLEAINLGAQMVQTGEVDIVIAGGTENMSQAPYLLDYKARFDGLAIGNATLRDSLIEGLSCPVNRYHMGVTAENVAERFKTSRKDQDNLALVSHQRAVNASKNGRFDRQIIEVKVPQPDR